MVTQLTLYGYKTSPYVEKIELVLKEKNISCKRIEVDLINKPAFFTERINPIGKVPVITYGGPDVAPDEPSPQSFKLPESDVILEFLADRYPEANLMPIDPVQRAQVRIFIDAVTNKYLPTYFTWTLDRDPQAAEGLLKVIGYLQGLLSDNGEYAVGNSYTIADACITPWIYRLRLSIEHDIGKYPAGGGPRLGESLEDPKYGKFMAYADNVAARPAAIEVWDAKKDAARRIWIMLFGRDSTYKITFEALFPLGV